MAVLRVLMSVAIAILCADAAAVVQVQKLIAGVLDDIVSSPDPTMTSQIAALQERLDQMERQRGALQERLDQMERQRGRKSSLMAYLPTAMVDVNSALPMKVSEQSGPMDAYNETGVYTAPYAGLYMVNFQLYPQADGVFNLNLVVGGATKLRVRCDDHFGHRSQFTCGSGLSLHLEAGDRLWMETSFEGPYWTSAFGSFLSVLLVAADE